MTGMGGGSLKVRNPQVTAHFLNTLRWQMLLVLFVAIGAALVAAVWLRRHPATDEPALESTGRRILRVGFGLLWVIDGLLQVQPSMPIGLPTQVVQPTVATAPTAVAHLVNLGLDAWLRHPSVGAAATVWLQLGLGAWLLLARDGWMSRVAGWASAGWALSIWVLGAGFGALFVPPITWFFGAPGATFYYFLAGVALGVPVAWWRRIDILRWSSRLLGVLFIWLGVIQALPGNGFWSSGSTGSSGALVSMSQQMSQLSQPAIAASIQRWFTSVTQHGSAVINVVAVVTLLGLGFALIIGRRRLLRPAVVAYGVVAVLAWIFVQDFGVFGGVGTDVNSMIPSLLVVVALVAAMRSTPTSPAPVARRPSAEESQRTRAMLASSSIGVFLVGALGMLALPLLPGTSIDAAVAAGSQVAPLQGAAPGFTLVDQSGRVTSLASLRGTTVVLSFLDPVCTSDCPIEAQELKAASEQLGPHANVTFVAVNANPTYRSLSALRAFNAREGMESVDGWRFLTGTETMLQRTWDSYGVEVSSVGAGGMVSHAEPIFVIRPNGSLFSTWTAQLGQTSSSVLGGSTTSLVVAQVKAAS